MTANSPLRIQVQSLVGNHLEFELNANATLLALRLKVAQAWNLPPACVILSTHEAVLTDLAAQLEAALDSSSPSHVLTAAVSSQPLHDIIRTGTAKQRELAVEDLAQIASRDYERSVDMLAWCLTDSVKFVRIAALDSLAKVSHRGDPVALLAVVSCLTDRSNEVRQAAVEALRTTIPWGKEEEALDVLRVCFEPNREAALKVAALDIIGDEAPRGHAKAVSMIITSLSDPESKVRCCALDALINVAVPGDRSVLESVIRCARDKDCYVRQCALQALSVLALAEDEVAVKVARELTRDMDSSVRASAAATLAKLQGGVTTAPL
eukprot:TRINITY_DN72059_c0_g1_i1.p1 TRINITY_DN72059_c0_g1~~TRINITY_DN72059_c0_g1_i1.p1  ORF type:complete len:350 (+),score=45.76 TRINITY_DN72059_c0_g1_i1:83-1051(+)